LLVNRKILQSISALESALALSLAALTWAPPVAAADPVAPGFLSAPSGADPVDVVLDHLRGGGAARGLSARDVAGCEVVERRVAPRTRATHVRFQQRYRGVDVVLAGVDATVDREGRLVAIDERLVRDLEAAIDTTTPRLGPLDAVRAAAVALDSPVREPMTVLSGPDGPARATRVSRSTLSLDDVPLRLAYVPLSGSAEVRLAWSVVVRTPDHRHWWQLLIDASDGAVLARYDWIAQDSYRVHPLPRSHPDDGPRSLESDPADPVASPLAWHDVDGVPGPEFTDTRGNNARAQEDHDADDAGGATADGGPGLSFDFPFDPGLDPDLSEEASITQLFFLTNQLHDVLYGYGFDEAAGNFQQNDYGRGGVDSDPVIADTLDGALINNANFGTPPDGEAPRMQMFVFLTAQLTVDSPPAVAGSPPATGADFGPAPPGGGLSGMLAEALDPSDGAGASTRDACSPLSNGPDVAGRIALVERGTCVFTEKVLNAQQAGAVGVIVYNNVDDGLLIMGGTEASITIPSVFVERAVGESLRDALAGSTVSVTLAGSRRDSSFDNEIVTHEYVHGVTNRLTGGAANVLCLQLLQSAGLGEGWSDFVSIALTHKPGATRADPRTLGAYSVGNSLGPGLRRYPYSTELAVNPLTLADLASVPEVHAIGEIWAVTLWEMYWNLVDEYGFDADLVAGAGGNNLALRLVIDALSLQPCSPTFTSARNAILQADLLDTGGANRCPIWAAFARRGVGLSANAGSASGVSAVADFNVPADCVEPVAQNEEQQRCIYAMNESLRKVMAAQGKSQLRCVSKQAAGSLSGSADVCLIADERGLLERASERAIDEEQRHCTVSPDFGKTDAQTIGSAGFAAELGLIHDVYGASLDGTLVSRSTDAAASRCQLAVAKATARCRNAQLQAFDRCKKDGLASGQIQQPSGLASCLGEDPRGKVAKACDPVSGAIRTKALARKCADVGLDSSTLFAGCATSDQEDLARCIERIVSCRTCAALDRADAMAPLIDCDLFDDGVANASCGPLP